MLFGYYSSGKDKKKLYTVIILNLVIAFISFSASSFVPKGRFFLQGIFIIGIGVACFFLIRYVLVEYGCEVVKRESDFILYVYQVQGKRKSTLLYCKLSELGEIRHLKKKESVPKKEVNRFVNATTAPFSEKVAVFVDDGGKRNVLILEENIPFFRDLEQLKSSLLSGGNYDPGENDTEEE